METSDTKDDIEEESNEKLDRGKNKTFQKELDQENEEESIVKSKSCKIKSKKTITDEDIKIYLNKHHIFPSFLKYDKNGNIDLNGEGLKKIDQKLINKEELFRYDEVERENNENIEIDLNNNFSASIIYFKNKFNSNKKKAEEKVEKQTYGIYKIYSFTIDQKHLSLDDSYLDALKKIAQSNESDLIKAKKLDEIFKNKGYLIPKKVYIGGIYNFSQKKIINDDKRELKINAEIKIKKVEINPEISNSNINKKISKENKLHICGGDIDSKDIEEWKSSMNIKKAQKIECDDIIPVTELINIQLKNRLKGPLKIINTHYELSNDYFNIIEQVKSIDLPSKKIGTYSSFTSLDQSILETPLIDCKCYFFKEKAIIFGLADKKIKKTFKETVIGIKIIDTKTSDHLNGDYKIKKNFLNTNEINIHFEAQIWRSISYFVIIYLLKEPELGMILENRDNFDLKLNGQKIGNMKDYNIENIIEDYFKKNKDKEIIEKTLQGKKEIEITFNENKKFNGKIETQYKKYERDDILDFTKKRLKPINSIKK